MLSTTKTPQKTNIEPIKPPAPAPPETCDELIAGFGWGWGRWLNGLNVGFLGGFGCAEHVGAVRGVFVCASDVSSGVVRGGFDLGGVVWGRTTDLFRCNRLLHAGWLLLRRFG